VDQRKVRLDDPISKYVDGVPDGNAITLRELAEMRSGLFDYLSNDAFVRAWFSHLRREWTPRQLLAYSFSRPLVFAPGTGYAYVNTNTVLLGLVVQKVSHQPLAVYIKRHILEPLRLTHTSLPAGAAFPSPHAQGYTDRLPACVLGGGKCNRLVNATGWNSSWGWAAGAMVSTLGDLRRWARAVATGKLPFPSHPETTSAVPRHRHQKLRVWPRTHEPHRVDRSQRIAPWLSEPDRLPALRTRHDRVAHQHWARHSPPAGVPDWDTRSPRSSRQGT
jgi:CubicO group peptidase (beta-lactamase class C family)